MTPQLAAGAPVTLVRIADHARLPDGSMATEHTLRVPRGAAGLAIHGPSLLAVGQVDGRQVVAEAEYFTSQGDFDVFRLCGQWRWVDTRRQPRYDTRMPAVIRSIFGLARVEGTLLNISAGGAAIHIPQAIETHDPELVLRAHGDCAALPVHVVNARAAGRGVVLHFAFHPLTAAQEQFLHDLLADLARA